MNDKNKLIAEFMGLKTEGQMQSYKLLHYKNTCGLYHSSWDWLMPVVEKIDQLLADDDFVTISYNRCFIEICNPSWIFPNTKSESFTIESIGDTRIETTLNAVCEFITWYNEN